VWWEEVEGGRRWESRRGKQKGKAGVELRGGEVERWRGGEAERWVELS
jgi:hypothetical protein